MNNDNVLGGRGTCKKCGATVNNVALHQANCEAHPTPQDGGKQEHAPRVEAIFSAMLTVLGEYDKKRAYFSDVANACYSAKYDLQKIERELVEANDLLTNADEREQELYWRKQYEEACIKISEQHDALVSSVNSIAGMRARVAELEGALQKIAWDCGSISSFHDRATQIARTALSTPPQENKA